MTDSGTPETAAFAAYETHCNQAGVPQRRDVVRAFQDGRVQKFTVTSDYAVRDCVAFFSGLAADPGITTLKISNVFLGDEGAASLAAAIRTNTVLKRLCVKANGIGATGSAAILRALRVNSALEELIYEDNDASDCSPLTDSLSTNNTLKRLSLASSQIGDSACESIAAAVRASDSIAKLDLSKNKIGAKGSTLLARALPHALSLEDFTVAENPIGNDGLERLAMQLLRFPVLDLRNCGLGPLAAERLAAAVEGIPASNIANIRWKSIDLGSNRIGSRGCVALSKVLPRIPQLEELMLADNKIGDKGASSLARASASSPSLRRIALSNNIVCDAGGLAMAFLVAGTPQIDHVAMDMNFVSEEAEIRITSELERSNSYHRFDLSNQQVRDNCPLSFAQEEEVFSRRDDEVAAISAIWEAYCRRAGTVNARLEEVVRDILGEDSYDAIPTDMILNDEPSLGEAGIHCIAAILEHNRSIVTVDLSRCNVSVDGARSLVETLRENPVVRELRLAGNPSMGSEGAVAVCDFVARSRVTEELDLSSCGVTDRSILVLVEGLVSSQDSCSLLRLNLSGNERITAAGATHLANLAERCYSLEQLSLDGIGLSDAAAMEILQAAFRRSSTHAPLMLLSMRSNGLRVPFVQKLIELLDRNPLGAPQKLCLENNDFGDQANGILQSKIRQHPREIEIQVVDSARTYAPISMVQSAPVHSSRSAHSVSPKIQQQSMLNSSSSSPSPMQKGLSPLYTSSPSPSFTSGYANSPSPTSPTHHEPVQGSSDSLALEVRQVLEQIRVLEGRRDALISQFRTARDYERESAMKETVQAQKAQIMSDPSMRMPVPPMRPVMPEEKYLENSLREQHSQRFDALLRDIQAQQERARRIAGEKRECDQTIAKALQEMEDVEKHLRHALEKARHPAAAGTSTAANGKTIEQAEVLDARKSSLEQAVYDASLQKSQLIALEVDTLRLLAQRISECDDLCRVRHAHLQDVLRLADGSIHTGDADALPDRYQHAVQALQQAVELHNATVASEAKAAEAMKQWQSSRDDVEHARSALLEAERAEERRFAELVALRQTVREAAKAEQLYRCRIGLPDSSIEDVRDGIPRAHERYAFLAPLAVEYGQINEHLAHNVKELTKVQTDVDVWVAMSDRRTVAMQHIESFSELKAEAEKKRESLREYAQQISGLEAARRGAQEDMDDALASGDLNGYKEASAAANRMAGEIEQAKLARQRVHEELHRAEQRALSILDDVQGTTGDEFQELLLMAHMEKEKRVRKKMANMTFAIGAFVNNKNGNVSRGPSTSPTGNA